jgi:hypothetical protein
MDDEALSLLLQRSSAGGKNAVLVDVVKFVLQRAGQAFASGDDAKARVIRDLGHELQGWQTEAEKALGKLNSELQT